MSDTLLCAAEQLRDALYVAMAEANAKPCKMFLSPSTLTPIDTCCNCGDGDGQGWVSIYNAKPIYSEAAGFTPCGYETEVLFILGIARCAATIDDRGRAPTQDMLNADAEKQVRDYGIMRAAILEQYVPAMNLDRGQWRMGDYSNHPVRGGCMAATHELYVRFSCL